MKKLSLLILSLSLLLGSCNFFTPTERNTPIICLTFDDQRIGVYTYALPEMNIYGYRGTCYVNSFYMSTRYSMNLAQVQSLHNDYNWEIGGHSLKHEDLAELTYDEVEYSINQDYWNLYYWGLNPRTFAMPTGKCPLEYYPILTTHYKYLRGCNDYAMHIPLNIQGLGYLAFQSSWTADIYKERIRRGIANGEDLIILGFHAIEEPDNIYGTNCPLREFKEILRYINHLGLEVLPLYEAVEELN
ncbi:MAG TPA: polysaccharide deacetylase family protein [Candidatus Cloacimonas sp.]|jgi:peptidoglycan/xylan/chitin deacetylase (PgdA/CDA1 family)|nr:polysaccharide deacetylase family protein [Candidatus Cloacimonas sp.]HOG27069.1 polysaccharide deacetylase family protein [Candidatus Cloacimonas sp.]HPZ01896.1 polysaccharide deacetylase family protein [Candidatus Cloacimonas sp.]